MKTISVIISLALALYSGFLKSRLSIAEKKLDDFIRNEITTYDLMHDVSDSLYVQSYKCKKQNELLARMLWKKAKNNKWYKHTVKTIKERN